MSSRLRRRPPSAPDGSAGRVAAVIARGRYLCPRNGCTGIMIRLTPWSHDVHKTGYATFVCSFCRSREKLVVAHYDEEEEVGLHRQRPTYTGRARCPRCGEPMTPTGLGGGEGPSGLSRDALRFACGRCGGARDVMVPLAGGHRARGRPGRVLVVDGDVGRGLDVGRLLEEEGKTVALAVDEPAALDLLEGDGPWDALVVAEEGALDGERLLVRRRRRMAGSEGGSRGIPYGLVLGRGGPGSGWGRGGPSRMSRLPLPCDPSLLTWFVAYATER